MDSTRTLNCKELFGQFLFFYFSHCVSAGIKLYQIEFFDVWSKIRKLAFLATSAIIVFFRRVIYRNHLLASFYLINITKPKNCLILPIHKILSHNLHSQIKGALWELVYHGSWSSKELVYQGRWCIMRADTSWDIVYHSNWCIIGNGAL